jgi:hypothetical protein
MGTPNLETALGCPTIERMSEPMHHSSDSEFVRLRLSGDQVRIQVDEDLNSCPGVQHIDLRKAIRVN